MSLGLHTSYCVATRGNRQRNRAGSALRVCLGRVMAVSYQPHTSGQLLNDSVPQFNKMRVTGITTHSCEC